MHNLDCVTRNELEMFSFRRRICSPSLQEMSGQTVIDRLLKWGNVEFTYILRDRELSTNPVALAASFSRYRA